jgi:hypothetical protein
MGLILSRQIAFGTHAVWRELLFGARAEKPITPEALSEIVGKALSAFQKGCEGGHAAACNNAGVLKFQLGHDGTGSDQMTAGAEWKTLFAKSCALDYKLGCVNLAWFKEDVEGFRDLVSLCSSGVPEACQVLLFQSEMRDEEYCFVEDPNQLCIALNGAELKVSEEVFGDFDRTGILVYNGP